MTQFTRDEIDQMRDRGFDPETIRNAESLERTAEVDALCELIRNAFRGVTLGDGVGLLEGLALDDYATEDIRRTARGRDEMESWESIASDHLNACHSSLCFFDAQGMRFHLPAFLIADLRGDYGMDLLFNLRYLSEHNGSQFALLNEAQRRVVRQYLQFCRQHPDSASECPAIDRALNDYWTEPTQHSETNG